jgi:Tol biopolymer transport system component
MMFKGTAKLGPGEGSRILRELGAEENAFTSDDYTAYYQVLSRDRLEVAFELEADRLASLQLPADEFAREIEVIKEERRLRTDDRPGSLAYERFKAMAYPASGYHIPTIGWMADLQRMNIDDLRRWYQRWYAPNNATLVVVGDVDEAGLLELVAKHYGDIPPAVLPAESSTPEPVQQEERRLVAPRPIATDRVLLGWKAPGQGDPDWAVLDSVAPPHIVSIVRGCLVKDPKQRYADIAVPLHLLTNPTPASATILATSAATTPLWRRALPVIAAASLAATLLTVGVAWYTRSSPSLAAVTRFSIPLGDVTLTNTGGQAIAISPDGSRIVYTANRHLYARSMADPEPRLIPGLENVKNYVTRPAISPDGSEVVFWNADNASLTRVAIVGGPPVTICQTELPTGVRWETDGILFGQIGKGIFKVPAAGGAPELVAPTATDENASSPQSLPGGRGLLYSLKKGTDSWDKGRIVIKTAAGEVKTVLEGGADGRYDGAGRLFYAVSGIVMAIPFDLNRLATTGPASPVIPGVLRFVEGNNSGVAQYSLADNGTLVFVGGPTKVVDGAENALLALFDDKGNVTRLPIPTGFFRGLRASPDARTVAYDSGSDTDANIWVQDLEGKTASRRLTFGGRNTAPVWSPDNRWIAFRSDREGDEAIFRQRADGSGAAERLTKPEAGTKQTPHAWSPDGARLVYEIEKDGMFQLHVLALENRTSVRFGDVASAVHMEPALSPDGRWIVYQRNDQSGPYTRTLQAFVEPFPGTGAKYLVPVAPVAGHPQWSRTGDRLIFNATATSSTAVDFHATPLVEFGPPTDFPRLHRTEPNPLINRRNSDAMPGGKLLGISIDLAVESSATRRDQINVILNWHQTLESRLSH